MITSFLRRAGLCGISVVLTLGALAHRCAEAQPLPGGIVLPGTPVVTGFSGIRPGVAPVPPGVNPADKSYINLNGPSLRVIDARNLSGSPQAQLVAAGKLLSIQAAHIGQVFAVALDDAVPPNIYAAATSVYGLPIVVPDADGDGLPDRARTGAPNAEFMLGLFGPHGGGPGTIWKINGVSGEVSVFANVVLDGVPNSGPALGGLAFDSVSRQILVADRDTGMIHAFRLDGRETGRFDHGVQGLAAVGLPPIAFDMRKRLDIRSPEFDATNPSTWAYAPPARRVFGLAVHRGRLYYAVAAGLRIWSVSIAPNGAFGADARVELAVPPGAVPGTEISKIIFDDTGAMLVAERGAPTGAYDFGALTAPDSGRVLRFQPKPPDDTPFLWQLAGEYAIGFPPDHRNADGGIAIGHGFDAEGFVNIGACGGTLWSTGSQLRISSNPEIAQRLAAGGPLAIDGLQANAISLLRPQNAPPQSAYFIDYDDVTERANTRGHVGDVVAWRYCPPWFYPQVTELLLEQTCPAGFYFSGSRCRAAPCGPGEIYRAGHCEKPQCVANRADPLCCPPGTKWNPRTQTCDKPPPRQPDLAINKTTVRCGASGACVFRIVVTNVGDAPYTGPIVVGDQVNPGQVTSITPPPSGGWQCAAYPNNIFACQNPNATLQPNQTLVFTVQVTIPPTLRGGWRNCGVVTGDPAKETNWSNNKSCVSDEPKPEGKPNLKVEKVAPKSCTRVSGNTYRCEFTIRVTNDGSADLTGEAVVSDIPVSPGRIVSIGGAGWTCQWNALPAVCRNPGGIRAGQTQTLTAVVEQEVIPNDRRPVKNCVYPGTVDRGSLPVRSRLAATAIPRDLLLRLAEGPTSPSGPSLPGGQNPPQPPGSGPPTPPGSNDLAGSCAEVSLPLPEAPQTCAPNQIAVRQPSGPPRCCTPEQIAAGVCTPGPGQTTDPCPAPNVRSGNRCCTPEQIRNRSCIPPPTLTCPAGQRIGEDGKCHDPPTLRCPTGQRWDGRRCIGPGSDVRTCKKGLVWDGKRCVPGGSAEKPKPKPKPQCQPGFRWDGRRCVPPSTTKPKKPSQPIITRPVTPTPIKPTPQPPRRGR